MPLHFLQHDLKWTCLGTSLPVANAYTFLFHCFFHSFFHITRTHTHTSMIGRCLEWNSHSNPASRCFSCSCPWRFSRRNADVARGWCGPGRCQEISPDVACLLDIASERNSPGEGLWVCQPVMYRQVMSIHVRCYEAPNPVIQDHGFCRPFTTAWGMCSLGSCVCACPGELRQELNPIPYCWSWSARRWDMGCRWLSLSSKKELPVRGALTIPWRVDLGALGFWQLIAS